MNFIFSRKFVFYTVFLCLLPFLKDAYAGDAEGDTSCHPLNLREKLGLLRISPTINTNQKLLEGIAIEYGDVFTDLLQKKHKPLRGKADGKFNKKTLDWIRKKGFEDMSPPGVQYMISPFGADVDYGAAMLVSRLVFASNPKEAFPILLIKPAFLNEGQYLAVRDLFNDKKEHTYVVEILKRNFFLTEIEAKDFARKLFRAIFGVNGHLKHQQLAKLSGHTVNILGHGQGGGDSIMDSISYTGECYGSTILYSKLIDIIKPLPNEIDISLATCYAGMGTIYTVGSNTGKSKKDLIELFKAGQLKTLLGDEKNSFAYKFSEELYKTRPAFSGKVTAPYALSTMQIVNAWSNFPSADGKFTLEKAIQRAVGLRDINDKIVWFDRSELITRYQKSDFYPVRNDSNE